MLAYPEDDADAVRLVVAALIGKSKGEWAGLIGAGDVVVSVNVVGGCGS